MITYIPLKSSCSSTSLHISVNDIMLLLKPAELLGLLHSLLLSLLDSLLLCYLVGCLLCSLLLGSLLLGSLLNCLLLCGLLLCLLRGLLLSRLYLYYCSRISKLLLICQLLVVNLLVQLGSGVVVCCRGLYTGYWSLELRTVVRCSVRRRLEPKL